MSCTARLAVPSRASTSVMSSAHSSASSSPECLAARPEPTLNVQPFASQPALGMRRWYGDERVPSTCFMERKTHRESWKGEESVKDRFTLSEPRMLPFLVSEFTVDQAKAELQKKVAAFAAGRMGDSVWRPPAGMTSSSWAGELSAV